MLAAPNKLLSLAQLGSFRRDEMHPYICEFWH